MKVWKYNQENTSEYESETTQRREKVWLWLFYIISIYVNLLSINDWLVDWLITGLSVWLSVWFVIIMLSADFESSFLCSKTPALLWVCFWAHRQPVTPLDKSRSRLHNDGHQISCFAQFRLQPDRIALSAACFSPAGTFRLTTLRPTLTASGRWCHTQTHTTSTNTTNVKKNGWHEC